MQHNYYDVIVIGSGFSGIATGIELKKLGIENFTILERANEVGGTWRDNHYPGAACDVPSHLYSFSFEPFAGWTRKYGKQKEIFAYLRMIAEKYNLRSHIQFNTEVLNIRYQSDSATWKVFTADEKTLTSRAVVTCAGGLSRPSYPQIPGIDSFRGKIFHSADWQHDISLDQKKVCVIGTGASAIQIIPAISSKVKKLFVMQRTPAYILPKRDRPYNHFEMKLKSRVKAWERLMRYGLYWRLEIFGYSFRAPNLLKKIKHLYLWYLKREIKDPDLRKKLTPDYLPGCKRILISDDFYQSLRLPQVELINSGIDKITPDGLQTQDGRDLAFDVLICATGFYVMDPPTCFPIFGSQGIDLKDVWHHSPEAYLGTTVSGFPNFFLIVGPNTALGHTSMILMIEAQAKYSAAGIKLLLQGNIRSLDVKASVQKTYNMKIQRQLENTVWSQGGCKSWYQTPSGKIATIWPGTTFKFMQQMKQFDRDSYIIKK